MNQPATASVPLRVALLGLGTIGGAVASRLLDPGWRDGVEARGGVPPSLVAVGVRDPARRRPVTLPSSVELTADPASVIGRPDVDVVVELMGGLEPATELVVHSLEAGRSVVTANKALLAAAGPRLEATARRSGAALRFEAAVGGGTPILDPLARDLAANRIDLVRGIVNGTTNFILTAMAADGREYAELLTEAQQRGYAEPDPSADVEAHDPAQKLVVLVRLALGVWLDAATIPRAGITEITAADMRSAAAAGLRLKLVAAAERRPDGLIEAWVEPCAVDQRSVIARTDGVWNVFEVAGEPVGRLIFQGPGAGGAATSSAVLADLLALARGEGSTWGQLPAATTATAVPTPRSAPRFRGYRLLED